ncbi:hypothetical protein ACFPDQ_05595 [Pseudofrancisella aestuarii]|uniref:Uncharacterized protein n=1 Tax=Pseudofrancisella aestuarii TaxID=2670347 RepID=A0ABV9TD14_9GAMM|nr:hypothetical protein [Pseudofrancisella aestuarii]
MQKSIKLSFSILITLMLQSCLHSNAKTLKCADKNTNDEVNALFKDIQTTLESKYNQKVKISRKSYDYDSYFWGNCWATMCGYNIYGKYSLTAILSDHPESPMHITFNDNSCSIDVQGATKKEWHNDFISFLDNDAAEYMFCNNVALFFENRISEKDFSDIPKYITKATNYCDSINQSNFYKYDEKKYYFIKYVYKIISENNLEYIADNNLQISGASNDNTYGRNMYKYYSNTVKNSFQNQISKSNPKFNGKYIKVDFSTEYNFKDSNKFASIDGNNHYQIKNTVRIENKTPKEIGDLLNTVYKIVTYAKLNNIENIRIEIGSEFILDAANDSNPGDYVISINTKNLKTSSIKNIEDLYKYVTVRANIKKAEKQGKGSFVNYIYESKNIRDTRLLQLN